jgi:hypothetical protein
MDSVRFQVDQEHRVADRKAWRSTAGRSASRNTAANTYLRWWSGISRGEKKDIFDKMTGNVEDKQPGERFRQGKHVSQRILHGKRERERIHADERYTCYKCVVHADSKCAFPLISLSTTSITVTLRPIQEQSVRDVFRSRQLFPYVQPDFRAIPDV